MDIDTYCKSLTYDTDDVNLCKFIIQRLCVSKPLDSSTQNNCKICPNAVSMLKSKIMSESKK